MRNGRVVLALLAQDASVEKVSARQIGIQMPARIESFLRGI